MRSSLLTIRSFLAAVALVCVGLACTGDGNIVGPGPPASVSVVPAVDSVPVGETLQLSATLLDSEGNPLPTSGVTWTSSDSQIAQVSADGVVSGMSVGGPVTITAIVQAHVGRADITVTHGPPSELRVEAQPASSAQSGVALAQQPAVQLLDAYGNEALEPSVLVTAVLAEGQGTLENATATTDAQGQATFSGLAISGTVGSYRIRFESVDLTAVESNAITLGAGAPATIDFVVEPSSVAQGGVAFSTQPQVVVLDAEGNPVGGTPVTVTLASGQGTVIGAATVTTDGSGLATFTDLGVSGPAGDLTLRFSAGSATLESSTITLVGVPATVTVLTQPSSTAQAGTPLAQQPIVEVKDADGHFIPSYDVVVTIGSGGGTVGGTTTVKTNGSGIATFTDLAISGLVGTKTLQFTAGSASVTSDAIDLQAGPLANLTITQQPSSTVANAAPFPAQPIVEATDASGNTLSGVSVTAEIASGGGTLGGTASVNTNGSGLASFSDLSITGTVGARTLRFFSGAIDATSNSITVDAGAPATATILTQPPEFTFSGVTLSQPPVVEVRDVSGNLVNGAEVVASIDSGGGALGGTTSVDTGGGGTATFSNLSISGSPGARTLSFTASAAEATSDTVNLSYSVGDYTITYCGSQLMDVRVPSNAFARPRPVAVHIHGGGWTSGDRTEGLLLEEVRDELVSRGYVVASLDYRLATDTSNAWPAQIHDVKCAVRHLRALAGDYGTDGRIGAWGASAGGHLVSMLGVTDAGSGLEGNEGFPGVSSRIAAAVPIGGISDITDAPDHPELPFMAPPAPNGDRMFPGSWPAAQPNASPITWASADDPPFLVIHGDQDDVVLPAQATKMFNSLAGAFPAPTLQWVTPGGHNLEDVGMGTPSPTLAQLTQQIANFFDTHVF